MKGFIYALLISATFVIAFFICLTAHAQPPLHSAPAVVDAHNHKVGTLLTQGLANHADVWVPGQWLVVRDEVEITIFAGRDPEHRAKDYAKWLNGEYEENDHAQESK